MTRVEYNRAVDHFADDVYRFIHKMCRSKEMAEDVVQDSFMKLWEEVARIEYGKAKSFLFSTAYHRMIDILRREAKSGDIEEVAVEVHGVAGGAGFRLGEVAADTEDGDPFAGLRGVFLRGDRGDHGTERVAGESVYLSGEGIYEGVYPSTGCCCLSGRRYDNERELRDLFDRLPGGDFAREGTGRGGSFSVGSS